MPPTTTNNATGLFLRKIFPRTSTASAAPPIVSEVGLVSSRCLRKLPLFSQKLPCAPWMPNNLGNCVLARNSATPHLNPTITLSEMKLTIEPALTSQAMKAMSATSNAVPAASAPNRARVAARNSAQRRADEQRDGGRDRDGRVPRTAKQPEDQPAKQARVKSRFGRQVGERRVAEPGRQQIRRERDAGDDVSRNQAGL